MSISRQKVEIAIIANDDGATYAVAFGEIGVFRKWSRLTLEQAEQQAADFAEEVRRQRTGRPTIVREYQRAAA
jgi:hypothetical protein